MEKPLNNDNDDDHHPPPPNRDTEYHQYQLPTRYIYNETDMEEFRQSPVKRELISFVSALGRSCIPKSSSETAECHYFYDTNHPLTGLSPGLASLHGSLRSMADSWLAEIPPDKNAKARFGNPSFRAWYQRLLERSNAILESILDCTQHYHPLDDGWYDDAVLEECSQKGHRAALKSEHTTKSSSEHPPHEEGGTNTEDESKTRKRKREDVITELTAYLHSSFGHPTRLDYGTGHESSFVVFLYALLKIGCFGDKSTASHPTRFGAVALSITSAYLRVTRGLQSDYMLEPAGSHGVWGLDDYHCLPFYFGACQLINNSCEYAPKCIHDEELLEAEHETYMYFGCIRYIKSLKKGVPFFESSPMLDDISSLPTWAKVSKGLLKLYEGEVLDKLPVVQHFVFGQLFKATWKPSQQPRMAPTRTFINGPGGDECIAPWAAEEVQGAKVPSPTRAPWAK